MMAERTTDHPPRDFDGLKDLLISRREALPRRLVQVAAFALENPDEVAFGTVASVAAQAKVQPSTLIRFAQTLGYAGFTDLQDVFRAQLKSRWPDYRERLARIGDHVTDHRDGVSGLVDGFAESAIASIDRLRETVSSMEVDRAATLLADAGTIYLLGLRRVFPVSAYLAYALGKIGCRAVLLDNVAALGPEQLAGANSGDALVAISFSPYAPITVELAARAAECGVPIVTITDSPFSPLSANATVQLEVVEADYAGFRSLAATMALAMALAVAAGARREARD
ncbi:MAG: MurR/RpiR family transcriptional regulator [Bauldia litoralis]|uniref:MurR/RpiR family transcriptional regulator n=2 Tax=Bauldia litoralis TaxID=665467 RepID=UPI0032996FD7